MRPFPLSGALLGWRDSSLARVVVSRFRGGRPSDDGTPPISRITVGCAAAAAVILLGAAPAAPPEHPVKFIHADALKALLDTGKKVDIVDVRRWDAYVKSHIKGARSMPLRSVSERAHEISKTGLVVFY
jgi:Rhodanese-like domain